jgi:hypothetical protein
MGRTLTIEPIEESVEVADGQTLLDACLRARCSKATSTMVRHHRSP